MHHLEFAYRPGTQDELCIREVIFRNEYKLPDRFEPDDRIVDIGAHIGSFAVACLERGAKKLWCYEPVSGNFELLDKNLRRGWRRWSSVDGRDSIDNPPDIQIHKMAVWRNDEMGWRAINKTVAAETAMAVVLTDEETERFPGACEQVPTIPFDRVIFNATEGWKYPIRLCKIDAEGSEWQMLEDSKTLGHINELVIECHLHQGIIVNDIEIVKRDASVRYVALKYALENAGFQVSEEGFTDSPKDLPVLRATRKKVGLVEMIYGESKPDEAIVRDGLTCTVTHGSPVSV